MCGIAGIFSPGGRPDPRRDEIGQAMAQGLEHRGPDSHGYWTDDHILLAHRRLAIVELSPLGAQPMLSDSGRYVLSFNGEIYNFEALRDALILSGHQFRGHSDTEVLLALIDRDGLAGALQACTGMFAILLWDRRDRRLSLARDRMGEKPLYYGWCGDSLVFASELKAIVAHPEFDATPSPAAIADVLVSGYIAPSYSVYAAIRQVPPGAIVAWQARQADADARRDGEVHSYWDRAQVTAAGLDNPFNGSLDDAIDALHETLGNAVALQSRADVPVGVFLSGGIDSSLVTALMMKLAPDRVRSYSIGFLNDRYDEAVAAREVAAHLGTQHTELYVSEDDALAVVPRLAAIYDEPFADSSQIPMIVLSELTRRDVTVALSGDGADELLGGYNKYSRGDRYWSRHSRPVFAPLLKAADRLLSPIVTGLEGTQIGGRLPWHSVSSVADLFSETKRADFIRSVGMLNRRGSQLMRSPGAQCRRAAPSTDARLSYRRAAMIDDMDFYLPGDILTKVDRATMSASLESRAPFLDHHLVELCARFPDALLFDEQGGKRVARHLLYRLVPRTLVDRPKAGFVVPLGDWLRGDLRTWANDLLASQAASNVLNTDLCRRLLKRHCEGQFDLSARIWPVLSVAAWAVGAPT